MKLLPLLFLLMLLVPLANVSAGLDLPEIAAVILNILGWVVLIIMSLALINFLWGVAQYILSAGDEAKKVEGRNMMIYGIIALFVMVAVWGLVRVLRETFLPGSNLNALDSPQLPSVRP